MRKIANILALVNSAKALYPGDIPSNCDADIVHQGWDTDCNASGFVARLHELGATGFARGRLRGCRSFLEAKCEPGRDMYVNGVKRDSKQAKEFFMCYQPAGKNRTPGFKSLSNRQYIVDRSDYSLFDMFECRYNDITSDAYDNGYNAGLSAGLAQCLPLQYDNWSEGAQSQDFNYVNDKAQVWTNEGYMQGKVRDNAMVFTGVRFTDPPVRFQHSQPVSSWRGVYQANKELSQVPGCMQTTNVNGDNDAAPDFSSEDCLFLNIWTPPHAQLAQAPNDLRPVIVMIHGGSWVKNTGADNLYNGNRLAKEEGALVISLNYRLNAFGFFKYTMAGPMAPGNQGLMDIVQALRWIKANIQHFYGNPDNIILMGQSAGADMVSNLVAMNPNHAAYSEGLIHKAVLLSSPWMAPTRTAGGNPGQQDLIGGQLFMHTTHSDGRTCLEWGGADQNPQLILHCMMTAPAQSIANAGNSILGMVPTDTMNPMNPSQPLVKITTAVSAWSATIDGDLIDMQNFKAFEAGRIMDIPIIMGATSGDGVTFVYGFIHSQLPTYTQIESVAPGQAFGGVLYQTFREHATAIASANYHGQYFYANKCDGSDAAHSLPVCDNRAIIGLAFGDFFFKCPINHFISSGHYHTRSSDTFIYQFDVTQGSTLESKYMREVCDVFSCHAADVGYWFGSFDKDRHNHDEDNVDIMYDVDDADWRLSAKMRKSLGNFAWNSNPSTNDRPSSLSGIEDDTIMTDCWPKANDHTACDNDPAGFIHRFYRDTYTATENVTPYMGEMPLMARCQFWHNFNKFDEF